MKMDCIICIFAQIVRNHAHNKKQYNAIVENIDIQETDTILDIGFGNGYLLRKLSNKNPQKMCGIEISTDFPNTQLNKSKKRP